MAFPDLLTNLSRTILTGKGGAGTSRFKHIVEINGRYRHLIPNELDQIQDLLRDWTNSGTTDRRRAFYIGNALVVGIPHAFGIDSAKRISERN